MMSAGIFVGLVRSILVVVQCMPGDQEKVLVTSNDSRIRVYDNHELWAKYKGM